MTVIHIASRRSDLAMAQTREVIAMLQDKFPDVEFVIGGQDTIGDQVLDRHLSELGTSTTSGLFTKNLEEALLNGSARFAVHSLKDMPTTLPAGLVLAAICKRENPEDAVVVHPKHKAEGRVRLQDMPTGSVIGTSSLRREALLHKLYPNLEIKTLRGNIQTRLRKLEEGDDYDAIIVAACGFRRGGLGDRIDEVLPVETFGYGVGQGSIGIECRADDQEILDMLAKIEHEESAQMCTAERSLLYTLEGGCQIAMGVNTTLNAADDTLTISATLLSRDGQSCVHDSITGPRSEAEGIGKVLAERFLENSEAVPLLGDLSTKRPLSYGNMEQQPQAFQPQQQQ